MENGMYHMYTDSVMKYLMFCTTVMRAIFALKMLVRLVHHVVPKYPTVKATIV